MSPVDHGLFADKSQFRKRMRIGKQGQMVRRHVCMGVEEIGTKHVRVLSAKHQTDMQPDVGQKLTFGSSDRRATAFGIGIISNKALKDLLLAR